MTKAQFTPKDRTQPGDQVFLQRSVITLSPEEPLSAPIKRDAATETKALAFDHLLLEGRDFIPQ